MSETPPSCPLERWQKPLYIACAFLALLGLSWVLWPCTWHQLTGHCSLETPLLWQYSGIIALTAAATLAIAFSNMRRFWFLVPLAWLSMVANGVAQYQLVLASPAARLFNSIVLTHHILWLIGLSILLYIVFEAWRTHCPDPEDALEETLQQARCNTGISLWQRSWQQPLLLVFLRHKGCPFCKEALSDLKHQENRITRQGVQPIIIHMSKDDRIQPLLHQFGLEHLPRISDPCCKLYRAFFIERGSLKQVLGPMVWLRGFALMLLGKHCASCPDGDVFQLPGAFVVHQGQILKYFVYQHAADRADFEALVSEAPLL